MAVYRRYGPEPIMPAQTLAKDKGIPLVHALRVVREEASLSDVPSVLLKGVWANVSRDRVPDLDIVVSDLRLGAHPFYAFQFKVGECSSEQTDAAPVEQIASEWRAEQLESMLRRIWTPTAWPPPG